MGAGVEKGGRSEVRVVAENGGWYRRERRMGIEEDEDGYGRERWLCAEENGGREGSGHKKENRKGMGPARGAEEAWGNIYSWCIADAIGNLPRGVTGVTLDFLGAREYNILR